MTDTVPPADALDATDGKQILERLALAHALRTSVTDIYHERGFDQLRGVDLIWVIMDQLVLWVAQSRHLTYPEASEIVRAYMLKVNLEIEACYALQVVAANAAPDKPSEEPSV